MIDVGGSIATFVILFPILLGISGVFFYIRREIKIKEWKRRQAEKEV